MINHNEKDNIETCGWALRLWEYHKIGGECYKDPKEIGGIKSEFVLDTFEGMSYEEKKKHLKFMFDRLYNELCDTLCGPSSYDIQDYKTTQAELEKNVHLSEEDMNILNREEK